MSKIHVFMVQIYCQTDNSFIPKHGPGDKFNVILLSDYWHSLLAKARWIVCTQFGEILSLAFPEVFVFWSGYIARIQLCQQQDIRTYRQDSLVLRCLFYYLLIWSWRPLWKVAVSQGRHILGGPWRRVRLKYVCQVRHRKQHNKTHEITEAVLLLTDPMERRVQHTAQSNRKTDSYLGCAHSISR